MLGEPPAGFGAVGGRGASSQWAGIRHRAEGKVQLPQKSEVLTAPWGWWGAYQLRGGDAGLSEPLPQGTRLAAAGPGVAIEAKELDGLDVPHGLALELGYGVVEQVKNGQASQVTESPTVDLPNAVVMEKKSVQVDQASEHILRQCTDTVSMQEEMSEVDQIWEQVILQKVELVLLDKVKKKEDLELKKAYIQTYLSPLIVSI